MIRIFPKAEIQKVLRENPTTFDMMSAGRKAAAQALKDLGLKPLKIPATITAGVDDPWERLVIRLEYIQKHRPAPEPEPRLKVVKPPEPDPSKPETDTVKAKRIQSHQPGPVTRIDPLRDYKNQAEPSTDEDALVQMLNDEMERGSRPDE
ncbi:hypothetical protein C6A37_07085 [Desulfobacteraceae bacterium SEEP-SAG9]|nr:hypothetical protein C6A37_07085 [Desulfobacteraceae bacterium SEEP-SAG9]